MSTLKKIQEQMFNDLIFKKNPENYLHNPERLNVYSSGYFYIAKNFLGDDFPVTKWALGEENFNKIVIRYVQECPTKDFNVDHLGYEFPRYLSSNNPTVLPWVKELAEYECNKISCHHLKHEKSIELEEFKSVPLDEWENARFTFQPNLLLQNCQWPVLELSLAYQRGEKNIPLSFKPFLSHYIFYQQDGEGHCDLIDSLQYQTLEYLKQGLSFGEVFNKFENENIQESVFVWFQTWHSLKLITNILFK